MALVGNVFSSTLGLVVAELPRSPGLWSEAREAKQGLRVADVRVLEVGQQTSGCILWHSHVGDRTFDDVEGAAGLPQVHL